MNDEMRKEVGSLDIVHANLDLFLFSWSFWLSLGRDDLSCLFGLGFLQIILLDSLQEGKSGI